MIYLDSISCPLQHAVDLEIDLEQKADRSISEFRGQAASAITIVADT
jgi:hypothetical protein